jgi:SAM-dependent methyltransferase
MTDPAVDREQIEARIQRCYSTWGASYYADYYGSGAPYPPVHADLIRDLVLQSGARTVLDAGCGPASFLRYLSGDPIDIYGFDLTAEMVEEGKRVFAGKGLDPRRIWQGSVLDRAHFHPAGMPETYDAAVCIGVLPHIPIDGDEVVFGNLRDALRPGGIAIVEARNQLFSLFTVNRPSYEFIRDDLVRADLLLERAAGSRDEVAAALDDMKRHFRMDLPPVRGGKADEPGYDEVLSRTHNPLALKPRFEAAGFQDVRVLFYHYHALPPVIGSTVPELFLRESIAMEQPDDWRGYFMASAFLLCGICV